MRIFISYRRGECTPTVGRIVDRLHRVFGRQSIFHDVVSIEGGVNFPQEIQEAVTKCDVLLAVIGPDWFGSTDGAGRRLDDPEDFVRREVELALKLGKPIIPVTVNGASMP